MEQKKVNRNSMIRKLIQNAIHREQEGWPPDSLWGAYQPHRPDKPLVQLPSGKEEK